MILYYERNFVRDCTGASLWNGKSSDRRKNFELWTTLNTGDGRKEEYAMHMGV